METCFLSIIVPIYNVAPYLAEALDSLLDQDITEYEILCVNDGSTDASPEILDRYAEQHSRIRVFHKENGGIASARNLGLAQAKGKYIWFVDGDDLIVPNCLGKMKALIQAEGCQRLAFRNYNFQERMTPEEWDACRRGTLPESDFWGEAVVWLSVLDRAFLEGNGMNFRHPEVLYREDGLFMFELSLLDPKVLEIPDIFYLYRIRSGSLQTSQTPADRRKRLLSHVRVVEIVNDYYRSQGGTHIADRLTSFLWSALYEAAALPGDDAREALKGLKATGLYPGKRLKECTLTHSGLVQSSSLAGRALEFVCLHLHRPWAYHTIRLLYSVKRWLKG